jgi:hypothetical protein
MFMMMSALVSFPPGGICKSHHPQSVHGMKGTLLNSALYGGELQALAGLTWYSLKMERAPEPVLTSKNKRISLN